MANVVYLQVCVDGEADDQVGRIQLRGGAPRAADQVPVDTQRPPGQRARPRFTEYWSRALDCSATAPSNHASSWCLRDIIPSPARSSSSSTPLARRRRPCGLSAACSVAAASFEAGPTVAASSLDAWPARPPRPRRLNDGGSLLPDAWPATTSSLNLPVRRFLCWFWKRMNG
jgi:hypothetical protein